MMGRLALALGFVVAMAASPAFAGVGLLCDGPNGVSVSIPLGGGVGLDPLGATIEVNGQTWGTYAGATTPIVPAQSFAGTSRYFFDFADPEQQGVVAEVRLFFAHEDGFEPAFGGTLRVVGVGAWPIACSSG